MITPKETSNTFIKSTVFYTLSKFIVQGLSFISIPIFTRLLSQDDFGKYNTFVSWVMIFITFSGFGMSNLLINGFSKFENDIKSFLSSLLFFSILWSFVTLFAFILFINFSFGIFAFNYGSLLLIFFYSIFNQGIIATQLVLRLSNKYIIHSFLIITIPIFSITLSIILLLFSQNEPYLSRIYGNYIPQIIIGFFLFLYFLIRSRFSIKKTYVLYAIKNGLILIPHGLAMILLFQMDKIMISNLLDETQVALYSFTYFFSTLISLFSNSLNESFQPILIKLIKGNNFRIINSKFFTTNFLLMILFLLIYLFAKELYILIAPLVYLEGLQILPLLIISTFVLFQYQNYASIEIIMGKIKFMPFFSGISILVNFLLNLYTIPTLGIFGAALSTLFSFFILAVLHYVYSYRISEKKLLNITYPILQGFLLTLLLFTMDYSFEFFQNRTLVQIFSCVIIFIVILLNNEKISKIVNNSKT